MDEQPRILICRLSHIGDCILTLPMVNAIRERFPCAFIAWAVEAPSDQLLALHPGIDRLIRVPKNWLKKPSCWGTLLGDLRQHRFDIAFDPQGITKSALLGWLSGARRRVGAKGRWGRELSVLLNNELIETNGAHLVDRSLELLRPVEIPTHDIKFNLPICVDSQQQVEQFLNRQSLESDFMLINPGASWASKRWEVERFASVAEAAWRQFAIRSVVTWAGAEEHAMAATIHRLSPESTVVADKTSLRQLAALCQKATCFIGCDTGPLHIAAAVGTPCIGLYGTTRPEESGAYGDQHIAIQKSYQAGSCRQRRTAENRAMQLIQVADVLPAIEQILSQPIATSLPMEYPQAGC